MKSPHPRTISDCPPFPGAELSRQEYQVWGHFFNAEGMAVNNQGQSFFWESYPAAITNHRNQAETAAIANMQRGRKKL